MGEKTLTIIKLSATALLIIGILSLTFVVGQNRISEKDQRAINSLEEVLKIKQQKQNCLDNLTALQTEEYLKGVWDYCKTDDEKIKELKSIIDSTINGFEYENIDRLIQEKKDGQIINNTGMTAIEKLEGLLQTE